MTMKNFYFLLLVFLTPLFATAQTSKVFDNLSLPSAILKMERKYAVYLPPDYETSQRSYPVLYLFHGGGDDQTGWVQFGEVRRIADAAIARGEATPMVIIMPDDSAGRRGSFNDANGQFRYEDFFFQELMPTVEKLYRIKSEKRYRAVAGISTGGEAAFLYALHHPELFGSSCPLSPKIGPSTLAETRDFLAYLHQLDGLSDDAIEAFFKRQSVLELINGLPETQKKEVRWSIDCGDNDDLSEGTALAHIAMRKKGIPHKFQIHDGGHNWTFWRGALPEILSFVSDGFHQF